MSNIIRYLLGIYGNATKDIYIPAAPPAKAIPVMDIEKTSKIQLDFSNIKTKEWKGIVLHHSASEDGVTRDAPDIKHYHMSYRIDYKIVNKEEFNRRKAAGDGVKFEKPWRDVGYHFLEEYEGKKLVLSYGRPLWMPGAHAGHAKSNMFNQDYIGICVIGNFDENVPSKEQISHILAICRALMKKFKIKVENVIGHREVYIRLGVPVEKQCPGKYFNLDDFRELL